MISIRKCLLTNVTQYVLIIIKSMKNILHLAVFCIITVNLSAASIYQCISTAFNGTCKTKLYACTNHH